jgi:acyl carrier protein
LRYNEGEMQKFYQDLAEILEVDEVLPSQPLRAFETWDSLAALSVVTSVRSNFGVTLTSDDLRRTTTVADLEQLVNARCADRAS